MDSILSALYNEELSPTQFYPKDKKYKKLRQTLCTHLDTFCNTLRKINPSLEEQFNQIIEERIKITSMETEVIFQDSFCLGARLMMEVVQHDRE